MEPFEIAHKHFVDGDKNWFLHVGKHSTQYYAIILFSLISEDNIVDFKNLLFSVFDINVNNWEELKEYIMNPQKDCEKLCEILKKISRRSEIDHEK